MTPCFLDGAAPVQFTQIAVLKPSPTGVWHLRLNIKRNSGFLVECLHSQCCAGMDEVSEVN